MRVVFFGSDLFSYPSLKAVHGLIKHPQDLIVATRLLKPSGRGQNTIVEPPVAQYAQANGLNWQQIETKSDFRALQEQFDPQLAIAVSYGRLIPAQFINGLQFGGLNVHPSLLPQYRGAAPLQRAIMDLRPQTGVTVQTLHPTKFDHGRILWQRVVDLPKTTVLPELRDQLAELGAQGLAEVIKNEKYLGGISIELEWEASNAPLIDRSEYRVDFGRPAAQLDAAGRALGKLWFEQSMTTVKKRKLVKKVARIILAEFVAVNLADSEPVGTIKMIGAGEQAVLALKVSDGYIGARNVTVSGFSRATALEYFRDREKYGLGSVKLS